MKQSTRYTITILDQTFTLVSDESQEKIDALSELVNGVMKELSHSTSGSRVLLATLSTLTIANDLLNERAQSTKLANQVQGLIESIDRVLDLS